jgi:hypothetical protein
MLHHSQTFYVATSLFNLQLAYGPFTVCEQLFGGIMRSLTNLVPLVASCGNQCSSHDHTHVPDADFGAAPPLLPPHGNADLWYMFQHN